MNVFERLHAGEAIDIRYNDYQKEVHGEMDRCRQLCYEINSTPPKDKEKIMELENELLHNLMQNGTFFTLPFQIDPANYVKLGKNVFANHGLTMMSLGEIIIEDGVMTGPEVGLFTYFTICFAVRRPIRLPVFCWLSSLYMISLRKG